jgi:hypothetical protein
MLTNLDVVVTMCNVLLFLVISKLVLTQKLKTNKGIDSNAEKNYTTENNIENIIKTKNVDAKSFKKNKDIEENILISLPIDVLRFFLKTWIEFKNICCLDSVFCNKTQRIFFLNVLNEFIATDNLWDKYFEYLHFDTKLYLKWILKRNIFLTDLNIYQYWNNNILQYFKINVSNKNFFLKNFNCFLDHENFKNFNEEKMIQLLNSKYLESLIQLKFKCDWDLRDQNSFGNMCLISISNNCTNLRKISIQCNKATNCTA